MNEEKCVNCRFARAGVSHGYDVLQCHHNAPRWISGVGTGAENDLWPVIAPDWWCGDYEYGDNGLEEVKEIKK